MYIADLHIHSHYSRATSRDCDAPHLDLWARNKGIGLVGTGDFTHPGWREDLRAALLPAEEGLYTLREELRLPDAAEGPAPRFVLSGEISSIYKKNGRTRKVHNLILLPSLEAAEVLSARLEVIGNIRSDGRPILGLDSRDLLEITLEACPAAVFIPAHIWTPHFSLFGAFSGFDTLEECFEDLSPHIHALETGLSSDPPMNWRVSALDPYTLVSNSDAHSPGKLGREANLIDGPLSYPALVHAIETGEGFDGTIEFFPEEGKYHLDGHRACGVCLEPAEIERLDGKCPVCGKKLTIGVLHRTCALADRPEGYTPPNAKPFVSLAPLPEVVAASLGVSAASRKAEREYARLLRELGPEFTILRETALADIERVAGPCVAEGIRRLRMGKVERCAGYDGEFGKIQLLDPDEREMLLGQTSLLGAPTPKPARKKAALPKPAAQRAEKTESEPLAQSPNPAQHSAVIALEPVVAVVAGPGTGKTRTLVERISYLIETRGVQPAHITAVTFTRQAAAEMRARLTARLGAKAVRGMTIGTFHAVCLRLLDERPLLGERGALALAQDVLDAQSCKQPARDFLRAVSRIKGGVSCADAGVSPALYADYCARCRAAGVRDLDDLLLDALALESWPRERFGHLLVDEFQDINALQRQLIRRWSADGELFVIGDPDQSIYGFRGADAACFDELAADMPSLRRITLTQNYRSTPEILAAAAQVIRHNPGPARCLEAMQGAGAPVRLALFADASCEGDWVASEITRLSGGLDMLTAGAAAKDAGEARAFSEMAVLCRTRRQLDGIERRLRRADIPCVVSGRGEELSDPGVQGALAFFRFLCCPRDGVALAACLRLVWDCPPEETGALCAALAGNPEAPRLALGATPVQFLVDYDTFAPLVTKEKPRKLLERWSAIHGKSEALSRVMNMAVFHADMAAFLETLTLGEEGDLLRAAGKSYASGAVRLMTLHAAKGLEFPVVFLCGVNAGALPLERADRPCDLAEERRLFFVGMTRAREELILTSSAPSCFIEELPQSVYAARMSGPARRAEQLRLF